MKKEVQILGLRKFSPVFSGTMQKREKKKQWVRNRALIIIIWIISVGNFLLGCMGTNKILLGLWFFIYNILFLVVYFFSCSLHRSIRTQ